jgi:hypothetical protein
VYTCGEWESRGWGDRFFWRCLVVAGRGDSDAEWSKTAEMAISNQLVILM